MSCEIPVEAPIKILFLAADPSDAARLRLGQELRDIREQLRQSRHRDRFAVDSRESLRPRDLSQAIFDVEPRVVHFSGHGLENGELCFENGVGRMQSISPEALAKLFALVADQVECVLLNACYSEIQAKAIVQHIPFVIGMNRAIGDKAAIAFSVGFYKALGANRSIEQAYKFGCVEIDMEGLSESLTPVLYRREAPKVTKVSWEVVLTATIEDIDQQKLENLLTLLRQMSGDPSITLKKIERGSVKLNLEGSIEGFEQIKKLFEEGQLTELLDLPVEDVRQYQPTQTALVETEVKSTNHPLTVSVEAPILCCYVNGTSQIQIARITNIPNWYFERVVFPGQRLLFEALPEAQLEIFTALPPGAMRSDTIFCRSLTVEEEESLLQIMPEVEGFVQSETLIGKRGWGWSQI